MKSQVRITKKKTAYAVYEGAGDGIRTRECQLGRLMPYHLATPARLAFYRRHGGWSSQACGRTEISCSSDLDSDQRQSEVICLSLRSLAAQHLA